MKVIKQNINKEKGYWMYNGDSCEVLTAFPENHIHYSVYSPPFANLYVYSNSDRDLGNCQSDEEFFKHYSFIISEMYRITKPGRLTSVHCMDLPTTITRDGFIGLRDFSGAIIKAHQDAGWIYHSRVTIWKDPLIAATRTKALGLMHKQIQKDSSMCRQGIADYILTFRKPGENEEPISHKDGFTDFIGEESEEPQIDKSKVEYSHHVWRKYASPVWSDIRQTRTLSAIGSREEADERHICPLQLDVIERCCELWSNPNDVVLTPFMGIGSEVYTALSMGRKAIGIELKTSYFDVAVKNVDLLGV